MKLNGEFVFREIAGEFIMVPIGQTALKFNGLVSVNEVSAEIVKGIQSSKSREEIYSYILDSFDVTPEEAAADLDEFLSQLRRYDLLID